MTFAEDEGVGAPLINVPRNVTLQVQCCVRCLQDKLVWCHYAGYMINTLLSIFSYVELGILKILP